MEKIYICKQDIINSNNKNFAKKWGFWIVDWINVKIDNFNFSDRFCEENSNLFYKTYRYLEWETLFNLDKIIDRRDLSIKNLNDYENTIILWSAITNNLYQHNINNKEVVIYKKGLNMFHINTCIWIVYESLINWSWYCNWKEIANTSWLGSITWHPNWFVLYNENENKYYINWDIEVNQINNTNLNNISLCFNIEWQIINNVVLEKLKVYWINNFATISYVTHLNGNPIRYFYNEHVFIMINNKNIIWSWKRKELIWINQLWFTIINKNWDVIWYNWNTSKLNF